MQIAVDPSNSMASDRILRKDGRVYTRCREGGRSVYGENLIDLDGTKYREWIPWRSKMGALFRKKENIAFPEGNILYLGAAQGTTVSHMSDITDSVIYAVEFSPVAFRKLSTLAKKRDNIVPILADAFHPERYREMVPKVDILYQDVSQKDQVGMFYLNARDFLKNGGSGFLMLKSRSIDVTADPASVYRKASEELKGRDFDINGVEDLHPFQKDHAAILVAYK